MHLTQFSHMHLLSRAAKTLCAWYSSYADWSWAVSARSTATDKRSSLRAYSKFSQASPQLIQAFEMCW